MPDADLPYVEYLLNVQRDANDRPHVLCTFHGESAEHTLSVRHRNTQRATNTPQVVLRPGEQTCFTAWLPVRHGMSWGQQHHPIRVLVRLEGEQAAQPRGWARLVHWLRSLWP